VGVGLLRLPLSAGIFSSAYYVPPIGTMGRKAGLNG
jgi:hypothetical protein